MRAAGLLGIGDRMGQVRPGFAAGQRAAVPAGAAGPVHAAPVRDRGGRGGAAAAPVTGFPLIAVSPVTAAGMGCRMGTITTTDGVEIFYKDWGSGQPIVFSHGWPLSSDDWDTQLLFFLGEGYRVVAHDRRGHGRSSQVFDGHDMDHYADDLKAVVDHLDLQDAIHVGHSTG